MAKELTFSDPKNPGFMLRMGIRLARRFGLGSTKPADIRKYRHLMRRYTMENLVGTDEAAFRRTLESAIGAIDSEVENYRQDETACQRDLSIKFHWGHDHDFGPFRLSGRMAERHIAIIANFLEGFGIPATVFDGKDVLDLGCWTGGTSLVLAALGSRVTAVEEVRKYAAMAEYLFASFGVPATVVRGSLYDVSFHENFDTVYFPGVLYHLSDPVLALRILYNALRPGGMILVETHGLNIPGPYCRFEGGMPKTGKRDGTLNRGGWNWFVPSPAALHQMVTAAGFDSARVRYIGGRLYCVAKKETPRAIMRAGLSRAAIP